MPLEFSELFIVIIIISIGAFIWGYIKTEEDSNKINGGLFMGSIFFVLTTVIFGIVYFLG